MSDTYAKVSDTSPVHWCKNAKNPDHKCVYAICYDCKLSYDENKERVSGKNKRSRKCVKKLMTDKYDNDQGFDSDDDSDKCDHNIYNMQQTCDTLYFTSLYMNSVIEQEVAFPTKCSICHRKLSSENTKVKKFRNKHN